MSDQSASYPFQALFESALKDYEDKTGIPLANHPLAGQLQNCQSVESVTALLQDQARDFSEFRGSDRIMKSLKSVVSALSKVSATATVGQAIGMSFPPADAIHTGLCILLAAFKGVSSDLDALEDLLESIEHFLKRLDIYTKVPATPAMTEIIVKIMVELLSTLAFATKHIKQGRPKKFVKKLFGENEVEAVLQRLDRLTQDEARTTAAQTLEVVYGLFQSMRVVIDDGKASGDSVRDALETIQKMASEMNKLKRDKLQQDVRGWLSPPDPWKNQNIAYGSRHTGTAAWFVGSSTLSEWKVSEPSSLLWIHGKPGAGKSVLCSTIINNINLMRKSGLASLAFFYCDFREDEKRDLRGLLSSVLVQLCHQSDSYSNILSRFYLEHANGSQYPSDDALVQCLKEILEVRGQAPVYLIIDGLDECSNTLAMPSPREKILMLLEDLIDSQLPNLRICVTSRPEIDIKFVLEPLAFHSISLHDEEGQMEDIDKYIRSVVNTDVKMRRWKATDKEQVIDVLMKKSDGMFRWVYCQIVYLRLCLPGRIRHALNELPETLDETYERALRDINKANWEFAYRLLQCVAVAFRPLRVAELAEILSFDFKTGPIPKFHEGWCLGDPVEAVLSTTPSLLAVVEVEGSPVIQFSHFSVKEYLTSSRLAETNDIICRRYHVSMTHAHTLAAQACLGILLHLDKNAVNQESIEKYRLADYAAMHCVDHARFEGVLENVEDGMKLLFDPSEPHLAVWVWIYDPVLFPWDRTRQAAGHPWSPILQAELPLHRSGSSLHYAAAYGLHSIVKFLIMHHSQDVHSRRFDDEYVPLHVASLKGHKDVARVLIEHGGDVTAQTKSNFTSLDLASVSGHEEVAHLLLKYGADATTKTKNGSTPLHVAQNEKIARSLLEHGADATAQMKSGSTPLHTARNEEIVRLLLEHGADATAQTKDGSTPLHMSLNEKAVRLLLENGADAKARNKEGLTPLHLAQNEEVARLLLEHGADATAQTKEGSIPLHLAAENKKTTRFLLKHSVDATDQTEHRSTALQLTSTERLALSFFKLGIDGRTTQTKHRSAPLHLASQRGSEGVTRLLLEHGANAAALTKDGTTPLHLASTKEVARLLLDHGADATAQTEDGTTPLHLTSERGREEVARLLLEHGADATVKTEEGTTPLHLAAQWGRDVDSRLLLEHGADATAQNKHGSTPLHLAVHFGHAKVVHSFLQCGADVTEQRKDGSTLFHLASRWGRVAVASLLFEHGLDATAANKHGWTPLHLASRWGHVGVVLFLLDHGADATARNNYGSTPLRLALQGRHVEVARLLVKHGEVTTTMGEQVAIQFRKALHEGDVELARVLEGGGDVTDVLFSSIPDPMTCSIQHLPSYEVDEE